MDDVQDLLTSDPLRGCQYRPLRQHCRDGGACCDVLGRQVYRGGGRDSYRNRWTGLVERQVHGFGLVGITVLGADDAEWWGRGLDFEVCGLRAIV